MNAEMRSNTYFDHIVLIISVGLHSMDWRASHIRPRPQIRFCFAWAQWIKWTHCAFGSRASSCVCVVSPQHYIQTQFGILIIIGVIRWNQPNDISLGAAFTKPNENSILAVFSIHFARHRSALNIPNKKWHQHINKGILLGPWQGVVQY